MRILQLVTRRQLRGAEVFAAQLSDRLVDRGCEVVFAGLYAPGEPPLETRKASTEDLGQDPSGKLSWRLARTLSARIRSLEPDLIQANGSDTLKYSVLARRLGRTPPLVYRNISLASRWLRGPLHRLWNRILVHRVDRVAAVSQGARQDFAEVYGYPLDRIVALPIGVEVPSRVDHTDARRHLERLLPSEGSGPLLLHVGSFTPEKNHAGLLEAFRHVLLERPSSRLVLIGEGVLRSKIAVAAVQPPFARRVFLLGAREDARELMAGADLLLLTSTVEGIPGVVLEAAARAVPSVVTEVGTVAEAVLDGTTGRCVAPGDPQAFAHAVLSLVSDPQRRQAMGQAARSRVRRLYDLDQITDRFFNLYRDLTTLPRGS